MVWAVAALLVVVLVILILIPRDKLGIRGERDGFEGIQQGTPAMEDVFVPDEAAAEDLPPESESTMEATQGSDQAAGTVAPAEEEDKYFLIAGSFSKLINASDLQDKLSAMGYETQILVTENRMYRVSVASFANKDTALQELAAIQRVLELGAVWLLSNE